ncbi:MAG: serine protease [Rhodovulum sulfidophilum]|uniref:Probable periplasmic serine endoprotease DegP-like n=1 Tax=Rhodovulum sulfidophilum TaxID=35806 RepID=A0A2W5NAA9_RHOSU|nr:MAG: serine protease [Rhodovulum sulfidophilum]
MLTMTAAGTSMTPAFAEVPANGAIPESFADLAARLSPAVVDITTTTRVAQAERGPRPVLPEGSPFEEFFRDFMDRNGQGGPGGPGGPNMPRGPERSTALGSGFIISADGYIVTNNHVIDGADEIKIEFLDGKSLPAEVVGTDSRTDIALLKVTSPEPLPFVPFGDSDKARVGDWVMAIGNPLGQGFSVSAGIVSARNRTLQGSYDDFIQTDAAINRGNSGGPLFNTEGEVIGVNTAILSPNGGSIGIGFAMSSAVVSRVVDQLRDFGETRRGWLGVRIQNVDPDVANALGLKEAKGALVTDVPDGPALKAGMKSGDVIVKFGDEEIDDTRELVRVVADTATGTDVPVIVYRDGKETTLTVAVGKLEETTLAAAPGGPESEQGQAQSGQAVVLGMTVAPITDELRQQYQIDDSVSGLVVTAVEDSSDAFAKGIREGNVISKAGQDDVTAVRDLRSKIDAAESGGRNSILLLVNSEGGPRFIALNLSN